MDRKEVRAMANTNVPPIPPLTFPNDLPLFRFWLQRMLPTAYTDAMSYSELLDKVIAYLNSVIEDQNDVNADLKALYEYVEQLYQWMKTFEEGGFEVFYEQQIWQWICMNMPCIIASTMSFFAFYIDEDGHVCVDMPSSWKWLEIKWDMQYGSPTFGQIEMEW